MFPLLLELADDPDVEMRRLALASWSWTDQFNKDPSAQPVLHRRLKDVDPYCRMQAARAIYLFDPNEFVLNELHGSDVQSRLTAIVCLAPMGRTHPELLPHLAKYATDKNVEIRALVMWALQSYGRGALPILCAGLEDPAHDVRRNAAVTLGLFGPNAKEAIPALVRCSDDGQIQEVGEALFAIDPAQFPDFNPNR